MSATMHPFTNDGTENRMRWDRQTPAFMEVWYATLNHRDSGTGLWFRYTITAPEKSVGFPYCELWASLFDADGSKTFAGRNRFDIASLGSSNGRDDGALVRIGDAWLSESHLEGQVERDGRTLAWSLDLEPADRCFQHLPEQIRGRIERRVSTVCSPNLSVPFTGTVTVDGTTLHLDKERGCQSHRWGRRHSLSWAWAHSSGFEEDPVAVFEGVAAQAAIGPLPAPRTTFLYLEHQGEELSFNDLRSALTAKSRYAMPTWSFTAKNRYWKIAGAARAPVDRFVQVTYADPDGSKRYCANSEIADLAIEVSRRDGSVWRHAGSLSSYKTAHLEFGRREPFPEIPIAL